MRIRISKSPFTPVRLSDSNFEFGMWPAHWIASRELKAPSVTFYRLNFYLSKTVAVRLHVAADERYRLKLDGTKIGFGNDSGDLDHWFYDSYELKIQAGHHTLEAEVFFWGLNGQTGPQGRISLRSAFLIAAEGGIGQKINSGTAPWECSLHPLKMLGNGPVIHCHWVDSQAEPLNWKPAVSLYPGRHQAWANEYFPQPLLRPSELPEMYNAVVKPYALWASELISDRVDSGLNDNSLVNAGASLLNGEELTVSSHSTLRIIYAFENYVCAYFKLKLSGGDGSQVRIRWAEALFEDEQSGVKGKRQEYDRKIFSAPEDIYTPSGRKDQYFEPPFWYAGRLMEITVTTGDSSLCLQELCFTETHYPLQKESAFDCEDPAFRNLTPYLFRTLQMCMHDIYMDCPYYERLMYIGDARIEGLTAMTFDRSEEITRHSLELFALSRMPEGLTQSRYPSRAKQLIPTYSLIYIVFLHDYLFYREGDDNISPLLNRCHEIINFFETLRENNNLLSLPHGWNFIDWAADWQHGIPPVGNDGLSGTINWLYVYALSKLIELEAIYGEKELVDLYRRRLKLTVHALNKFFWNDKRGLFADDTSLQHYSEHTQCLAVLSHQLSEIQNERIAKALRDDNDITRSTVYFSHYLFDAAYECREPELFYPRLKYWFDLASQGFMTVPERPEPSRSDCHAWGTHPFFHYFATILGIRPTAPGFRRVKIAPMPGKLKQLYGKLVHPRGKIRIKLIHDYPFWRGKIELPDGVDGTFVIGKQETVLHSGINNINITMSRYELEPEIL